MGMKCMLVEIFFVSEAAEGLSSALSVNQPPANTVMRPMYSPNAHESFLVKSHRTLIEHVFRILDINNPWTAHSLAGFEFDHYTAPSSCSLQSSSRCILHYTISCTSSDVTACAFVLAQMSPHWYSCDPGASILGAQCVTTLTVQI